MEKIVQTIVNAKKLIVFTGAGISKASGIQTFRDMDGLWKDFDPQVYATFDGFINDPEKVWKWYLYRYDKIKQAKPNEGHYFVATLENYFKSFAVITQNVDGLHQKAGSKNVIELHGSIHRVKCISCKNKLSMDDINFDIIPPLCECGGLLRPDVVWFGEALPEKELTYAFDFARNADVVIVIGTSCVVYPAAEIPYIVKRIGGKIIELNPEYTQLTPYVDFHISNLDSDFYKKLISEVKSAFREGSDNGE